VSAAATGSKAASAGFSEVKDIQFAYTRMFIEREAVMGAFNFSDLRQNSNVSQQPRRSVYQAYRMSIGLYGPLRAPAKLAHFGCA